MEVASRLVKEGSDALLERDWERAKWCFDAAAYLNPALLPGLWQRGLLCYYSRRYEEGMCQFERDMDVNGGDLEEVLWNFICKSRIMGFEAAQRDGFLRIRKSNDDTVPPPMIQVLALFQGKGSVEAVLEAATPKEEVGVAIPSYNGCNALGYAHFYIGLYHELQGQLELADTHLHKAVLVDNPDYVGSLAKMHYRIFKDVTVMKALVPTTRLLGGATRTTPSSTTMPGVIYGGWQLSTGHGRSAGTTAAGRVADLLRAIDTGIGAFDCGDIYTGVEELYGHMLKAHLDRGGRREEVRIHTKLVPDLAVIRAKKISEEYILGVIRRSLNRLQTDYIDLLQFYQWDVDEPGSSYIDTVRMLVGAQERGLIRQIGLTNFDHTSTQAIIDSGVRIASTQVQFSVLDRRPLHSGLCRLCQENGVLILAYGVLAGGLLTDKWIGRARPEKVANRSLVKYLLIVDEFGSWDLFQELLRVLRVIADSHSPLVISGPAQLFVDHVTVAMVAVAYVLSQPGVGGVILGSINTESRAKEAVVATHLQLTQDDISAIQDVLNRANGPVGVVFGLERQMDGRHGNIMKYNLSQLNQSTHLEELCRRFLELHFSAYAVEATRCGYRQQVTPLNELRQMYALRAFSYDHTHNMATKPAIKRYIASIDAMLEELSGIDGGCLDADQKVDHELMMSLCRLELVRWKGVRMHEKDPALYLPFEALNYLLPVFGRRSSDDISRLSHPGVKHLGIFSRLVAFLSRVRSIPSLLEAGQENLTQPVRVFTERAIKLCSSFKHFLSHDVPGLVNRLASFVGQDSSKLISTHAIVGGIVYSAIVASESVGKFEEFLSHTLLPKATESVSLGRELYDSILLHEHFITDSNQLLELGERHFAQVKEELALLSREIDATKTWQEITRDVIRAYHPSAANLLDAYVSEIHRAKEHMVACDLVPQLPCDENVIGFHTPAFLMPFSPFGDFLNPACFSGMGGTSTSDGGDSGDSGTGDGGDSGDGDCGDSSGTGDGGGGGGGDGGGGTGDGGDGGDCGGGDGDGGSGDGDHSGYLMLHSVAAMSLSAADEERMLQSHDYTWISVIAPHECYPGHHLQALLAQQHPRVIRKYHESTLFYEGWGLYCEQLAYETGFFDTAGDSLKRKIKKESQKQEEQSRTDDFISNYSKLARLTQLRLQLWRAARVMLDIRVHRGEMTLAECQEFLCREVMFEPRSAAGEVSMYVSRPCYAPCYVAGFVKLMALRERAMTRQGSNFSLKDFHTAVLSCGCLPLLLLEQIL